MKRTIRLSEAELVNLVKKVISEQSSPKVPEDDQEFMDWVANSTVKPFIAPNPYDSGDLKLGVQISHNDGQKLSMMDKNKFFSEIINLIERMDVTTENGKSVHTFQTLEQDGSGSGLFNHSTFRPKYEVIDNSYVVYSLIPQESEFIQKLKRFSGDNKANKFIVTVTPRLSTDILKTGSKIFTTKPNVLMVT